MRKRVFCPVTETIYLIGKKWSLVIIYMLEDGPRRFNELKNRIEGISSKTLSYSLKELENHGIIQRIVHSKSPIRVEYSLTESGRDLEEIFIFLKKWGDKWLK